MSEPTDFRFDVRVRDRFLRSGRLTEDDVKQYLDALTDRESTVEVLDLKQPALGGRDEPRDVLPAPFGRGSSDDLPPPPPPPPLDAAPTFDPPTRPLFEGGSDAGSDSASTDDTDAGWGDGQGDES